MMNKKENFKKIYKEYIKKEAVYIGVLVKTEGMDAEEMIINPNANFYAKLDYYLNAYDNDMALKRSDKVKIVAVTGACELEDLNDNVRYL